MSNAPLAVVSGASSGIGLELSRKFIDHGFDVLMVAEDDGIEAAANAVGGDAFRTDLARYGRFGPMRLRPRITGHADLG